MNELDSKKPGSAIVQGCQKDLKLRFQPRKKHTQACQRLIRTQEKEMKHAAETAFTHTHSVFHLKPQAISASESSPL